MSCSVCKRELKPVARGLCNACYQRWLKRGTTDYAPKRKRGVCSVADCNRPHAARGFCDLHHQRVMETGDPEQTKRPDDWGAKSTHPLYHRWSHMRRHRGLHPMATEWDDFLQFATDVGGPPDNASKLFSADDTKPIGPGNFVWKRAITERVEGEDEATYQRRRARAYRHVHKERFQAYDLKKHYGLSRTEADQLHEEHKGLCAICRQPERAIHKGKPRRLAVDHCHATGKIRGLLCHRCNRGLGYFGDDPGRLMAALQYLITA